MKIGRPIWPAETLKVLRDPEAVVDRGVGIARGDRIADPEELELAVLVADDGLRLSRKKLIVRDLTQVPGVRLEFEVQFIERDRAMNCTSNSSRTPGTWVRS